MSLTVTAWRLVIVSPFLPIITPTAPCGTGKSTLICPPGPNFCGVFSSFGNMFWKNSSRHAWICCGEPVILRGRATPGKSESFWMSSSWTENFWRIFFKFWPPFPIAIPTLSGATKKSSVVFAQGCEGGALLWVALLKYKMKWYSNLPRWT